MFADLLSKHRRLADLIPRLRRYARALLADPAAADELVRQTLVRAASELDIEPPSADLRGWVFALMHAIYARDMRAMHADDAEEPGAEPAPAGPLMGPLQLRDLERALAQLPPEQRAVLLLVTLEGMGYEEVARLLGISVGTVIARLARARRKLRALLLAAPKLTVVK